MHLDASGRPLELRDAGLERVLAPRTVAVVGASETPGTQQRHQWEQVRDRLTASGATVVPVHPTKPSILGTPAFASVLDVPFDIDVALVLVREPIPVLEQCLEKGVGAAVVFAAGFAEVGTPEGAAAARSLEELASGPMRVLGPNTNLNLYEPWRRDLPGRRLAIITQSGHQGRPIAQGQDLGIPIQSWATVGNEVDLEFADFVAHYASLPETGAIAAYVEGFKDGRTLLLAAERAARARVPIVCIKAGRTEAGRRMAQAHTGHLAGSDAVHDGVFRQAGMVRVDDLDELLEISAMFCRMPLLERGGIAVYALSGGTATHLVDLCSAAGLEVPRLAQVTIDGLREHIPWFLSVDNPVDSGGAITATPAGRKVLDLLVADPHTDVLLVPITGVVAGMSDALARDVADLHAEGNKPLVVIWGSPRRDDPSYQLLLDAGVPLFHSFGAAVRGLKALVDFSAYTREYESPFPAAPKRQSKRAATARKLLTNGPLDEVDSKRLLVEYGIPVVQETAASSGAEAVRAARAIGYPVVVKALGVAHKSDAGLVRLGVRSDTEVRAAYRDLGADRVVVQQQVDDGVAEVILGLVQSPPFGPTVMFGLGGTLAEVLDDVAFRVPPFTKRQARAMVDETRAARLLRGVRGKPTGDVSAVVDTIMRLQRLALEVGDAVAELDINPLIVRPRGQGVVAVDALVVPA